MQQRKANTIEVQQKKSAKMQRRKANTIEMKRGTRIDALGEKNATEKNSFFFFAAEKYRCWEWNRENQVL